MQWFMKAITNYINFNGRARRKEYWMFVLFSAIFSAVISIIEQVLGLGMMLSNLYAIFILIPSLSVGARRLHDIGRTGWWMLLLLLPVIGWIVLIIFHVMDSQPGENKYGPYPK